MSTQKTIVLLQNAFQTFESCNLVDIFWSMHRLVYKIKEFVKL